METGRSPARPPYQMSFDVGGLLVEQATIGAALFVRLGDWRAVRISLDQNNLLHASRQATAECVRSELLHRLRMLTPAEVARVASGPDPDRKHLLWAAFARQYEFVGEFADLVLRDVSLLGTRLMAIDFDRFWTAQARRHNELRHLQSSSRTKLRANLYRAMREAGLLTAKGRVVTPTLSPDVIAFLSARTPSDLRFFPMGGML